MVPKYRSLCCQHVLGPLFGGHIPSSFWNNCNICHFGTQGFLAFCHYEAYLFVFPLQNVDLDKHISPRRSESNPPPFSVKWNPGLHRHICVRLQSSVEKWSQKKFLPLAKAGITWYKISKKSWRFLSRDILRKAKTKWRRRIAWEAKHRSKNALTLYTRLWWFRSKIKYYFNGCFDSGAGLFIICKFIPLSHSLYNFV